MHGIARSSPMCFCRVAPQAAGDLALTNHEFSTIWIHLGVLRTETTREFCKATILGTGRGVVSAKKTKFWGYIALILWMVSCFFALTTACVSRMNHLIYQATNVCCLLSNPNYKILQPELRNRLTRTAKLSSSQCLVLRRFADWLATSSFRLERTKKTKKTKKQQKKQCFHNYNAGLFGKALTLVCFVVFIYYSCLLSLKLCIYVGHWESCWECTVVAFVTEAYRSNNVWFWKEQGLVSFAEMKCQKCKRFGAHNAPLPLGNINHFPKINHRSLNTMVLARPVTTK